jgi:hypothetical protein
VIERTFIGLSRASEILAEGMADEDQLAQWKAMRFLDGAAKRGLCEVWGKQGHKTALAKIEPVLLEALELREADAPSDDSEEYGEAAYEPKTLGTDFYEQRWSQLRYSNKQIAALKASFVHWRNDGTFQADQTVESLSAPDHELTDLKSGPPEHKHQIHEAISAIYDACEQQGVKSPNINEIVKPVATYLERRGFRTTATVIKTLADEPRHTTRRHRKGVTIRGKLKELSALVIP